MKHLAIASFVCGTVIVLAPIIQNVVALVLIAHLIANNPSGNFQIHGPLADSYAGWCVFFGLCLFVAAMIFALRLGRVERAERVTAVSVVPVGGVA